MAGRRRWSTEEAIWGRYASGGTGSRLVMEELLQALRASGLPDAEIPARYHRIVTHCGAGLLRGRGRTPVSAKGRPKPYR